MKNNIFRWENYRRVTVKIKKPAYRGYSSGGLFPEL